jgi:hypothetical protein
MPSMSLASLEPVGCSSRLGDVEVGVELWRYVREVRGCCIVDRMEMEDVRIARQFQFQVTSTEAKPSAGGRSKVPRKTQPILLICWWRCRNRLEVALWFLQCPGERGAFWRHSQWMVSYRGSTPSVCVCHPTTAVGDMESGSIPRLT